MKNFDDVADPVVTTPEKKAHVAEWANKFRGRRWFPGDEGAFEGFVDCVCDIVRDAEKDNPSLGHIPNDTEWLIKRALHRFKHCPSPRELRNLYSQYFTPADGIMVADDMEE